MSDNLPEKKRGRPPKPVVKTSRKDLADNAKFWLSLATLRSNPLTKKKELLSELDVMNLKMIAKAKSGNVNAYSAILDRAFGKPKQYTEATINQRVTIAAFAWAEDKLPEGAIPIPEPEGEEIEFEPVDLPDQEVQEFEDETEQAEE
jgi:hypothetical protein